ncbi:Uncharacterized membrane protein [Amphibacillus marinus]|uniref:Uncharacterized membrane protein n=1 Tax=Amphibacillus marinus TaxID=872970 RepID=A0A1H8RGN4_9BACI|nr:SdpI family protein [Amphibacillus marinus]SEO65689.1 Uncharacterized membrane protein [Amphibacillus marinus]
MKKQLLPLTLFTLIIMMWVVAYPQLPDQVPMQWGIDGTVNWTAPKLIGLLSQVGLYLFMYLTLEFAPRVDPTKSSTQQNLKAYQVIKVATLLLLFIVNLFIVLKGMGLALDIEIIVPIIVGLLFIIIGNYTQSVKQNYFMGIRTPWTLASQTVWRKTHRLGSRLFIMTGMIFILLPLFADQILLPLILTTIFLLALVPTIYSYYLYRTYQGKE